MKARLVTCGPMVAGDKAKKLKGLSKARLVKVNAPDVKRVCDPDVMEARAKWRALRKKERDERRTQNKRQNAGKNLGAVKRARSAQYWQDEASDKHKHYVKAIHAARLLNAENKKLRAKRPSKVKRHPFVVQRALLEPSALTTSKQLNPPSGHPMPKKQTLTKKARILTAEQRDQTKKTKR